MPSVAQPGQDAERRDAGPRAQQLEARLQERAVAAELVEDEGGDPGALVRLEQRDGPHEGREDAAAVDVADEQHRSVGRLRDVHVHDVAVLQVDLGRAPGPLDDDEVHLARAAPSRLSRTIAAQLGLHRVVLGRGEGLPGAAEQHHLRARVPLRLQEDRVHLDGGVDAGRLGLDRLGAPNLAAVGGDGRVERHVLRLEGRDAQPRPAEEPAEPGDDEALPHRRRGPLDHQRPRRHRRAPPVAQGAHRASAARKRVAVRGGARRDADEAGQPERGAVADQDAVPARRRAAQRGGVAGVEDQVGGGRRRAARSRARAALRRARAGPRAAATRLSATKRSARAAASAAACASVPVGHACRTAVDGPRRAPAWSEQVADAQPGERVVLRHRADPDHVVRERLVEVGVAVGEREEGLVEQDGDRRVVEGEPQERVVRHAARRPGEVGGAERQPRRAVSTVELAADRLARSGARPRLQPVARQERTCAAGRPRPRRGARRRPARRSAAGRPSRSRSAGRGPRAARSRRCRRRPAPARRSSARPAPRAPRGPRGPGTRRAARAGSPRPPPGRGRTGSR